MVITIEAAISKPVSLVWNAYTTAEHITHWNFASEDWHCPSSSVDLRVGGLYSSRMEAKDGSMGFDFNAVITALNPEQELSYKLEDERQVKVIFESTKEDETKVLIAFDAEQENNPEYQKQGWQAILDNFKAYVEALS